MYAPKNPAHPTAIDATDAIEAINAIDAIHTIDAPTPARWYALRTKSRHEKLVRDRLAGQGIEQFLPTIKRLSQWKDRKKEIEVPLFSGYCFARFVLEDRLSVRKTYGVANIVGNGHGPEPIPDEEIDGIRLLIRSKLVYDAHPYLQQGAPVEVIRGPLEGVRGVLLRKASRYRLVLAIHLIQHAAAVEIDAADVASV
ncbi:MAG: UpxY family transcription antiterminator [Nitrospirae bacterium]|nr:MAG: UpxY family transcription antiterminator [Nitrospirota bacterium]